MNDRKKADADFDAHFDSCDECKRAFRVNRLTLLCAAGGDLYDASLAAHDSFAISNLNEAQCLRELEMINDSSGYMRPSTAKRTREMLEARLATLRG